MYTVKQARVLKGMTQADVAKKMGVDVGTYRRIELNPKKASLENALKFCKAVGQNFNDIFFTNDSN